MLIPNNLNFCKEQQLNLSVRFSHNLDFFLKILFYKCYSTWRVGPLRCDVHAVATYSLQYVFPSVPHCRSSGLDVQSALDRYLQQQVSYCPQHTENQTTYLIEITKATQPTFSFNKQSIRRKCEFTGLSVNYNMKF